MLLLALIASMLDVPRNGAAPDLLLEGATVYVSAEAAPRRASVLVREGKVAFVGDAGKASRMAPGARRIDLAGTFLFAGWADAHGHLLGLGRALEIADLKGAGSAEEAARRLAERAAALPPGAWVEGRGWDQNDWPGKAFPDARDLDAHIPDRPVLARRVDGHAVWINTVALRAAGIDAAAADPPGGRILRRPDGSPSGVLVDNAGDLVQRLVPESSDADRERRLVAAARACARAGLTQVQDASGYGAREIAALERLAARGELPIRVYATVSPEKEALDRSLQRGVRIGGAADLLTVRAIKAYADGALGSRGAALLSDYSDEPGKRGLLVTPPERLAEIARQARENGWQLWIHAIGDRGSRLALDAFAEAASSPSRAPAGGSRPRIEHAQVIAPEDFARFSKLGIIASVQPTHATSDMPWAQDRVGPERVRGAYAWQRLRRAGARLAGGSDFPVESEQPLLGFFAAITRQDLSGKPAGGWYPEERLTRRQALALFTSDAAWAAFEEDRRGRVEAGFDADFTVFEADPMEAAQREIPRIPVRLTVVAGRVVFEKGSGRGGGQ
jgi:predicted amidohydrolase YtcJ